MFTHHMEYLLYNYFNSNKDKNLNELLEQEYLLSYCNSRIFNIKDAFDEFISTNVDLNDAGIQLNLISFMIIYYFGDVTDKIHSNDEICNVGRVYHVNNIVSGLFVDYSSL